jgi:hypothetical protein
MPTWRALARQRTRWKRGALENISDYGLTRVTAPYWGRQALSALSVIATLAYLLSLTLTVATGSFDWQPLWVAVTCVFILERVVTVRERGWHQQLLAAPIVIEMVFDIFLQAVQARAFVQSAIGSERGW